MIKRKKRLKKRSDRPIPKLKREAWAIFSRYIRLRDCLKTTGLPNMGACLTCGTIHDFKNLQAGHFRHASNNTYFDEKNVHAQDARCNKWLHGCLDLYASHILNMYGQETLDDLIRRSHIPHQFTEHELKMIATKYSMKIEKLCDQ